MKWNKSTNGADGRLNISEAKISKRESTALNTRPKLNRKKKRIKQKSKQSTIKQYVNKYLWLCSNKIVFTKTYDQSIDHGWSTHILDESWNELMCLTFRVKLEVHCAPQ